jgi:hypothetical protein
VVWGSGAMTRGMGVGPHVAPRDSAQVFNQSAQSRVRGCTKVRKDFTKSAPSFTHKLLSVLIKK